MLKKIGISLSILLILGILMSCEQQENAQGTIQEEVEVGNLDNDMIIKVDPLNEKVLLSGEEVMALEIRFEEHEDSQEVFYEQDEDIVHRCLKVQEQLLLIEKSERKEAIAKLKEVPNLMNNDDLWDLCSLEFENFSQE